MKKKILIIGGGFAGSAYARILSKLKDVYITLVEKSNQLGAGVRTRFYGGHIYTFGPRHFLTHNKEVFEYLNKILPMRSCVNHEFTSYVEQDNQFYNYPLHFNDIKMIGNKFLPVPVSVELEKLFYLSGQIIYDECCNTFKYKKNKQHK